MIRSLPRPLPQPARRSLALGLVSLGLVGGVMAADNLIFHVKPLSEGVPLFTAPYLARSAAILSAALAFVAAVLAAAPADVSPSAADLLDGAGAWDVAPGTLKRGAIWLSMVISTGFLALFLASPALFSTMALEDHPVEWVSAGLHWLAMALFIAAAAQIARSRVRQKPLYLAVVALLAVAGFVMGMEEVSWFQRVIGFATPADFVSNSQGEFNLHNFATGKSELIYYVGGFTALVAVPFIHDRTRALELHPAGVFFAPGRFLIFAAALLNAYTYNMWNSAPHQFTVYATLLVLALYCREGRRGQPGRGLLLGLAALFVVTQLCFLAWGDRMARIWDITEYKELLLPLAVATYAADVLVRAGRLRAGRLPAAPRARQR
jgi:hypothetical protein